MKNYFLARSFSAVMDELWKIVVPLWLVVRAQGARELAWSLSAWACGEISGFLCLRYFSNRTSTAKMAVASDLGAGLASLCIAGFLYFEWNVGFALTGGSLFLGFFYALWFGASETVVAEYSRQNGVKIHRRNIQVIALAPVIAATLVFFIRAQQAIVLVLCLNALSFFLQAYFFRVSIGAGDFAARPGQKEGFIYGLVQSAQIVWRSKSQLSIVPVSILHKIQALGFGFLIYALANDGGGEITAILVGAVIGLSTFSSAQWMRVPTGERLKESTARSFFCLLVGGALVPVVLHWTHRLPVLSVALVAWGAAIHWFALSFRMARQTFEKPEDFPPLIAGMGLFTRVGQPLTGVIMGHVYLSASPRYAFFWLGTCAVVGLACGSHFRHRVSQ